MRNTHHEHENKNEIDGATAFDAATGSGPVDIVLAFDTTGSMYPYFSAFCKQLEAITATIAYNTDGVRLGMIVFGDHCDAGNPYLLRLQPLTGDYCEIHRFAESIEPTGGGDLPEAVEDALHAANHAFNWRPGAARALVLVGDAPPHELHECPEHLDWRAEARQLAQAGAEIYAVQCGTFGATRKVWQWLADESNGCYLQLAGTCDLGDLILAVCMHRCGRLDSFISQLQAAGEFQHDLHRLLAILRGNTEAESAVIPAPQGTYRKLTAAGEAIVKDIVTAAGLPYRRGNAYYKLEPAARVRGDERFVIEEAATGQVYEGDSVADLLQPPVAHHRGIVYVQSKSPTRRVYPGESILYRLPNAS